MNLSPVANDDEGYVSYMLRMWRTVENGKVDWRATLEDARTGKRQAFSSIGGLVGFLYTLTGTDQPIRVDRRINSMDQLNLEVRVRVFLEGEQKDE